MLAPMRDADVGGGGAAAGGGAVSRHGLRPRIDNITDAPVPWYAGHARYCSHSRVLRSSASAAAGHLLRQRLFFLRYFVSNGARAEHAESMLV